MPRPRKNRIVSSPPETLVYKPAGVPARSLQWLSLTLDEYEVMRLLDHQGMDQQAASEALGVSRPTVTRIYASARAKIAQMLVEGKALKIEGGPVVQCFAARRGQGRCGRGQGRRGRRNAGCRARQCGDVEINDKSSGDSDMNAED